MKCGMSAHQDGKLVQCSQDAIWFHPRYNGGFCEDHKQGLAAFFPNGWTKAQVMDSFLEHLDYLIANTEERLEYIKELDAPPEVIKNEEELLEQLKARKAQILN